MDRKLLADLLDKYLNGQVTTAQQKLIEDWLETNQLNNDWSTMPEEEREQWRHTVGASIQEQLFEQTTEPKLRRRMGWVKAVAAVVVGLLGLGIYWFGVKKELPQQQLVVNAEVDDALPATGKALLTLADGSTVVLDDVLDAANEVFATEGTTELKKKGDQIIYNNTDENSRLEVSYNTLTTPKGGQYKLVLPDGSRVWLNADSKLRYPVAFPADRRVVELTGEAYFEVVSSKKGNTNIPFTVSVAAGKKNADINVLGTSFNVNAYEDEETMEATLLEGKIQLAKGNAIKILKPGQQASMGAADIDVLNNVNTEEVMAWKNGLFILNQATVASVLRQLSRWYDVEVEYKNGVPAGRISGDMPRNLKLSEVLKVIELSGIKFKITGKKIIVEP